MEAPKPPAVDPLFIAMTALKWALSAIALGCLGYQIAQTLDLTEKQTRLIALIVALVGGFTVMMCDGYVRLRGAKRSSDYLRKLNEFHEANEAT